MEFSVKSGSPEKQRISCVAVGVFDSRKLSHSAQLLDEASNGYIANLIRRGECEGKLGQTLLLHNVPNTLCDRILLIGCGREKHFDTNEFHKANSIVANFLDDRGATEVFSCITELNVKNRDSAWKVSHAIQATENALYHFDQLKTKKEGSRRPLRRVVFGVPSRRELPEGELAVRNGMAIASGTTLAKDLANLPANVCTPTYLAEQANALQKTHRNFTTNILEEEDMEKLGMGAFLSVSRGSRQPAKLIVMEYKGANKSIKPFVFVGKGVTFDSGGISLKPGAAMDEMKYDMCGSGVVLGVMKAVAELKPKMIIIGIIPSTENMSGDKAYRPGDVLTAYNGKTIEVLNTDAEGRLILADALSYASKHYDPEYMIDFATLTGAVVVALGHVATGIMGTDEALVDAIKSSSKTTGEKVWEFPLWDEYLEQVKSKIADVKNVGAPMQAGSIAGGAFLEAFVGEGIPWCHFDIAGTAWGDKDLPYQNKGTATGEVIRLVVDLLGI